MKKTAKLLCVLLTLVMLIGAISASAKTKATEIDEYISASFDVYNIPIVESFTQMKSLISEETIVPAIDDPMGNVTSYNIEVKKNGCLILYRIQSGALEIMDISGKTPQSIASYEQLWGYPQKQYTSHLIPVRKGDKISIHRKWDGLVTYVGFVPEEKMFNIDEFKKNNNGSLKFLFGNVCSGGSTLSVTASPKNYSTREVLTTAGIFEYSSVPEGENAVLTLPKEGEYTVQVYLNIDNETSAKTTFILDTDKYFKPSLDKLTAPISAVKGTNIIVGYAEPSATVYVEYNGNKYSWKADDNGIYRIIIDEAMKEGKPFKIWQKKGNLTSKKAKYRVTDNV